MSSLLLNSAAAIAALKPARPAPMMTMSWAYFSIRFFTSLEKGKFCDLAFIVFPVFWCFVMVGLI